MMEALNASLFWIAIVTENRQMRLMLKVFAKKSEEKPSKCCLLARAIRQISDCFPENARKSQKPRRFLFLSRVASLIAVAVAQ
jgi:hypothetical protein